MLCNRRTVRDCRRSVHSLRRRFGTFRKTSHCYRRKIRRRCRKMSSIQLNIKRLRREMGGFLYLVGQFAQHMHNSFCIRRKRCAGDAVRRAIDAVKHRSAPSRTRRRAKKTEAQLVVLPTSERFVPTAGRSQQICLGYERLGGNLCAQQVVCRRRVGHAVAHLRRSIGENHACSRQNPLRGGVLAQGVEHLREKIGRHLVV